MLQNLVANTKHHMFYHICKIIESVNISIFSAQQKLCILQILYYNSPKAQRDPRNGSVNRMHTLRNLWLFSYAIRGL